MKVGPTLFLIIIIFAPKGDFKAAYIKIVSWSNFNEGFEKYVRCMALAWSLFGWELRPTRPGPLVVSDKIAEISSYLRSFSLKYNKKI